MPHRLTWSHPVRPQQSQPGHSPEVYGKHLGGVTSGKGQYMGVGQYLDNFWGWGDIWGRQQKWGLLGGQQMGGG